MKLKSLFSKKKKEEVINMPVETLKEEIEEDSSSKKIINEEVVDLSFSSILIRLAKIRTNINPLMNNYFNCKIFSRASLDNDDFNALVNELDKYINNINERIDDINNDIVLFEKNNKAIESNDTIDQRKQIIEKLNNLETIQKIYSQRLIEINNNYYGQLKMSTVAFSLKMSNEELEKFYNRIDKIITSSGSLKKASEEIYYSSGEFVSELVNDLVKCIKLTKNNDYINKYSYDFFLSSDVVITLEYKEWIDLYNKIKYAYKLINDIEVDSYLRFSEKYKHFEAMCVILMMTKEASYAR